MAQLIDLGNNKYKVTTSKFGSREGSLRDIVQFMVFDMDFTYTEIEFALLNMNELGHDAADFGIFGGFITSFSTKDKRYVSKVS